jgi:outer membrane protein assembly factor BamB
MMRTPCFAGALALALLLLPNTAAGQDWPHWRGPRFDGSSDATGLPTSFDRTRGVAWSAALPGPSAATPIVLGEHVYLTSVVEDAGELLALCLDRKSGEIRWEQPAGSGYRPAGSDSATQRERRSNYASPSPVADAERVIFFFGNGDLMAFDHDGERLWARNLQADYGDFSFQWTFAASPTLWQGLLFLPVLQRDSPVNGAGREGAPSFLLALDPATGRTVYRHVRPSDALRESLESYATPIPCSAGGRDVLLVLGGDVLTGHDPRTGEELWRWGSWNPGHREQSWRIVPSPVVGDGVALVSAPKTAPVFAVELGGSGALSDEDGVRWQSEGRRSPVTSDVPTPLFYDGAFFVLSDLRETLARVDARDGSVVWSLELPGKHLWRASPTGADGKIWCMNHHGDVVVVAAGTGRVLAQAALGEDDDDGIRASIAIAHGRLFVRTNTTLFCVGA